MIAYEAVAWGTHTNTWQQCHDILRLADNHPNFRLVIDTYHIGALAVGEENTCLAQRDGGFESLRCTMEELRQRLEPSDIAYLQLSDIAPPEDDVSTVSSRTNISSALPPPDPLQPQLMTQSRNRRIFPCEGGTLPVLEMAKTVLVDVGFRGWVSMEVFHEDHWKMDKT